MKPKPRFSLCFVVMIACCFSAHAQYSKVSAGTKIMIAAHPLAAKAGLEVYRKGGNVVDAAVAVAYALGVVEPAGSGIGGEGMMLIYDARERRSVIIDFKAISPRGASYENLDFNKVSEWNRTVRGASVPGAVAGLELARERYGRLDRRTVLQPAIDYALKGFEVDSTLAMSLETSRRILEKDAYAKSIYYPEGKPAAIGTVIRNPDYGRSLQAIQAEGPDAFYRGKIAELIVQDSEKRGGFFAKEDLLAYKPIVREALVGQYRGYEVITSPPPCGGMFLIEALNILKHFDLNECRKNNGYDLHIFAETFKLVFKDERTHNGDPEFSSIPVKTVTSDDFAFQRLLQIDLAQSRHPQRVEPGRVEEKNTTHLSVMDIEGNAVALTITLSSWFGTGQTVEGAGFMLNNEMQNFYEPTHRLNSLSPHKRVVTSLVPTVLLKDGKPVCVLGTPGGDLIISTITQVIVNLVDYGMPLQEAIFAPRMFSINTQRDLEIEGRFPVDSYRLLESLGHDVKKHDAFRSYFGSVQAILYDAKAKRLIGCSDPRRSGAAVGE